MSQIGRELQLTLQAAFREAAARRHAYVTVEHLLYALLYLTGYPMTLDDLKNFRQWGSPTPGHPEYGETPGIETTTGPLGQGFATAVGLALAEAHLGAIFNRPGWAKQSEDHRVLPKTGYRFRNADVFPGQASGESGLNY